MFLLHYLNFQFVVYLDVPDVLKYHVNPVCELVQPSGSIQCFCFVLFCLFVVVFLFVFSG